MPIRRIRASLFPFAAALVVGAALLVAPALARGPKSNATAAPGCTVSDGLVTATGLPTTEIVNFLYTDANGTSGWVLGFVADGTVTVRPPVTTGATTYKFVSQTWGPGGSKYNTFASC